jgi:hypothetical protein
LSFALSLIYFQKRLGNSAAQARDVAVLFVAEMDIAEERQDEWVVRVYRAG